MGSAFDLREWKEMRAQKTPGTEKASEQLGITGGYDHNFVASKRESESTSNIAEVRCATSRVKMDVLTTESGVQFYSGNFLLRENFSVAAGKKAGKSGVEYDRHAGFCLETQNFPNCASQKADEGKIFFEGYYRDPFLSSDKKPLYESETI